MAPTIRPPPTSSGVVSVPAPNANADTAANSTSVTITTAVTLAGRRAAPYCSARLPSKNQPPISTAPSTQGQAKAGTQATLAWVPSASATASTPDTSAPPKNMASARAAAG